jgi:DNA-binding transcriptional MocR family regulator
MSPAPALHHDGQSRVDACVGWVLSRIDGQVFQAGMRLPSIRRLARDRGVSPFTVGQAYDRLTAMGRVEPRRGSGYYILPAARPAPRRAMRTEIDRVWLLQHMLDSGSAEGPGLGVLPASWLDGPHIADGLRALGREGPGRWVASGSSHGFEPLRGVLQHRLAGLEVVASADQIVLTTGITQALDLVLRTLAHPGEPVLVLEPGWFGALGLLASHGAQAVGVPCGADGPDLAQVEAMAAALKPRLMILSATAQNPTGVTLSPEVVRGLLDIAERHDITLFEDDVYADFGAPDALRLAAADGLRRVVYAGSFSKTLAPNLRVGFLAASPDLARALAETKILTGFTTPEVNERLLHRLLQDSGYARAARELQARVAAHRTRMQETLEGLGFKVLGRPRSGIFLWADMGCDTNVLAGHARERGLLLAPGSLFLPTQARSTWTRINVTQPLDARAMAVLDLARAERP